MHVTEPHRVLEVHRRLPARCVRRVLLLGLLATVLAACGKKGPPIPPEPRGPLAPARLAVRQVGPEFSTFFEVPQPRGTHPHQKIVRAELLRVAYPPGFVPRADAEAFVRRGTLVGEADLSGEAAGSPITIEDRDDRELADGGVGWTLRYAARILDQRGRTSEPVLASDLKPLPPGAAPRNLSAEPSADGIRLKWDEPLSPPPAPPAATRVTERPADAEAEPTADEPAEAGSQYNLYRTRPGEPWPELPVSTAPLSEREYLDGRIVNGERYLYVVRALLGPGRPQRESASSAAVEVEAVDRFAPEAPTGVVAVQEGAAVRLFWNPNREPDLAGYRVYRRLDGGDWQPIGPDPIEQPTLIDRDVRAGQSVAYRVTAVDRAAAINESAPADSREVVVAAEPAVTGGGR